MHKLTYFASMERTPCALIFRLQIITREETGHCGERMKERDRKNGRKRDTDRDIDIERAEIDIIKQRQRKQEKLWREAKPKR